MLLIGYDGSVTKRYSRLNNSESKLLEILSLELQKYEWHTYNSFNKKGKKNNNPMSVVAS